MKNEDKFIILFFILLTLHEAYSTTQFFPNVPNINSQQGLEFFQKFMNNMQIMGNMSNLNPNPNKFLQTNENYNLGNLNNISSMSNFNPSQLVFLK